MGGCVALIVAGGRGRRFGMDLPKQYQALAGRTVIGCSLAAFAGHPKVTAVRPVIHPEDADLFTAAAAGLDILEPVAGGDTRQDSVRRGLESLQSLAPDLVLIHDAARPLVDAALVTRVVEALGEHVGAVPGLRVADTLKRVDDGLVTDTVDRDGLWRVQTPQGFRFADILAAHRRFAGCELTDDAAVAEKAGLDVAMVEGIEENFKVTTPDDLIRAERHFGLGEMRVGQGFDVHRLGPGDHVILCGLRIPHDGSLVGHSDADVGLHAITDALLGALAAGDIGSHFPPSEARWKGAASDIFLRHAGDLVRQRRGTIVHIDVVLICERPKIGPHRDAMAARVAEILGIDSGRVSVKATTTEALGFTGRGEGIAAQAVATVRLLGA